MTEVQLGAYREGYEQGQADMLAHYSAALDEIFRLRRALAYEAGVSLAGLSFKTFPRSLREVVKRQAQRMRSAARGTAYDAYSDVTGWAMEGAMREAAAPDHLTRTQWEERP
jgi:hypothetical protein